MDSIKIRLSNLQYYLEFKKVKKPISFLPNSDYILYINFINDINQPILSIQSSESEYMRMIQSLDYLNMEIFNIYGDCFYFESSSNKSYSITIEVKDPDTFKDNPGYDENPATISTSIIYYIFIIEYDRVTGQSINRLYTEINLLDLENIIYSMYQVIEDIPYLDNLHFNFIRDMMEGE